MVDLSKKSKFPRTLSNTDFGLTADVTCTAGQWVKIGELIVNAQQYARWGANDMIAGMPQGRTAYIRLDSTDGQMNGVIRLVVTDANEKTAELVIEERTEKFGASVNDRTIAVLLPESLITAQQDSKLQILFKVGTTGTLKYTDTDTSIKLPVTIYQ